MRIRLLFTMLLLVLRASAQGFFNLTVDEVKIDSVVPQFCYSKELPATFADSVYSVSIDYPEFIDMQAADIERLHSLGVDTLPELPDVLSHIGISRKRGTLYAQFVPLVFREGRYQKLVSFKLTVSSTATASARATRGGTAADSARYAAHSVLAEGTWAKISVPATGIYQITDALIRQCGFSHPERVRLYGYGGALQPEVLTGDYLAATDDLKEVATCTIGGRRLFHAIGPVSWSSPTATTRTRNPYSDQGCYFLTEADGEPLSVDSAAFVASFYPTNNDYHSLYEVDNFAWYHSGRNLYDQTWSSTADNTYTLQAHDSTGRLTVALTYDGPVEIELLVNDSTVATITNSSELPSYQTAFANTLSYNIGNLEQGSNRVVLRQRSGTASVHLDYLSLTMPTAAPLPNLRTATLSTPRYVYRITKQDHHADAAADMVIIIPTNQRQREQAERLKALHESEGLRVNLVPADELYNEFASGTPDANAYRRYLKMLYDRAATDADAPRYLLLFGDGAWDNRMLTNSWRHYSPDDFLLCYESENSLSETDSYISDHYYALLDDGEGSRLSPAEVYSGKQRQRVMDAVDVGVGRLTARDADEARTMVDKIVDYTANKYAGAWQNTICFMGDDGNDNIHMEESNAAAEVVEQLYPGFLVKRIFWDAYTIQVSSKGKSFPDVTQLIKQQMQDGALVMNYCGHGAAYTISHEQVVSRPDFGEGARSRLPLWMTASCDIMPFDAADDNIGETAMLNPTGGAVAFYGTTRTVYTKVNKEVNCSFLRNVLATTDGKATRLGDAMRQTKNEISAMDISYPLNKLHYALLGDPAMALALPTGKVVVDSINGHATDSQQTVALKAGELMVVKGHVVGDDTFCGTVTLTLRDVEQTIVGKVNSPVSTDEPYVFTDRPNIIYQGADSVVNGHFTMTFVLPRDISYSDQTAMITLYALGSNNQKAHGQNESLVVNGSVEATNDGIGPSVYCYLNSPSFTNGGTVNATPYFFAEVKDKDGVNVAGSSVGHDLELVVDGNLLMTYNLNSYFQYDFGEYTSGTVGYTLPELSEGEHRLSFRAWDVLNNSSVAELKFTVDHSLAPHCFSVACTNNPATTQTTFIVNHDRAGSNMLVELEVFDASGRQLWHHAERGTPANNTYTLNWDLTIDGGGRLHTGVYFYRVLLSTDGSKKASQAKKLIIL